MRRSVRRCPGAAGADLIVLSCASPEAAQLAATGFGRFASGPRVLIGLPGDTLRKLRDLARAE